MKYGAKLGHNLALILLYFLFHNFFSFFFYVLFLLGHIFVCRLLLFFLVAFRLAGICGTTLSEDLQISGAIEPWDVS